MKNHFCVLRNLIKFSFAPPTSRICLIQSGAQHGGGGLPPQLLDFNYGFFFGRFRNANELIKSRSSDNEMKSTLGGNGRRVSCVCVGFWHAG